MGSSRLILLLRAQRTAWGSYLHSFLFPPASCPVIWRRSGSWPHLRNTDSRENPSLTRRQLPPVLSSRYITILITLECVRRWKSVALWPWNLNKSASCLVFQLLCPTHCERMYCSMQGFPVHHRVLEFAQIFPHWVSDAIQPSHLLLPPSPPALNLSQHQGLF